MSSTTFILHNHDTILCLMPVICSIRQATEIAEQGQLDEALALFQTLLKSDPNNAAIWNNIGIIQFRQGKLT
jgi:Flp pilus assembly protein TadD